MIRETGFILTDIPYEVVFERMRIPANYFPPEGIIVSVGEGLSNFAHILGKSTNATVVAVDQLYFMGKDFFIKPEETLKKHSLNDRVHLVPISDNPSKDLLSGHLVFVAGDAYCLPFANESIDIVVGNSLSDIIDLEKTLCELVRVVKVGGEIRLTDIALSMTPADGKLFPGPIVWRFEKNYGPYDGDFAYKPRGKGTLEALRWVKDHPEIKIYAFPLPIDNGAPIDIENIRPVGLIIRKDEKIPQIVESSFAGGDCFIVKPDLIVTKDPKEIGKFEEWDGSYYEITPLGV